MSEGRPRLSRACAAALLIAALTLPQFLYGLGDRHIWIPLEARYALVAREMLAGGHWILPHLGGEVYADKPPLLFWSIALLSTLGSGVTEWTARLPAALAAVGVCLVTWGLGVRLFSPTAGVLAALVLATSGGFFWSGRQALPDMLLTLWTTAASWALWEWYSNQRRLAAILAGVCMGLAILTKGPVGLLLPALSGLAFLVIQRQWTKIRRREVLLCLGAFFVVTLAWFVPAIMQGGRAYAQATLVHQSLERYVQAWEHKSAWYFFLGAFPAEFLPWMLFLPQALVARAGLRQQQDRLPWWFALCSLGTIIVFFSLSSGKRDIYILPAFPAAALLVGWMWSCWWQRRPNDPSLWAVRLPTLVLALILVGLSVWMVGQASGLLPTRNSLLLPTKPRLGLTASLLLALAGALLGGAVWARRTRLMYALIVGCTWLTMLVTVVWIYTPQFNQRYPIAPFAVAVRARVGAEKPLRLCGPLNDLALRFNLDAYVPQQLGVSDVRRYLSGEGEVFCLMSDEEYQRLHELTDVSLPIVARAQLGTATLLLVSNRR